MSWYSSASAETLNNSTNIETVTATLVTHHCYTHAYEFFARLAFQIAYLLIVLLVSPHASQLLFFHDFH